VVTIRKHNGYNLVTFCSMEDDACNFYTLEKIKQKEDFYRVCILNLIKTLSKIE